MPKRRKRKLILEKNEHFTYGGGYLHNNISHLKTRHNQGIFQGTLFKAFEPYASNRFIVFLENEYSNKTINPEKIMSAHFSYTAEKGNVITIESALAIATNDWIDEYKDVHICRIHLLDPTGITVKYMDFDVGLIKCEYKLNYSESEPLMPKFYYKIFD